MFLYIDENGIDIDFERQIHACTSNNQEHSRKKKISRPKFLASTLATAF